MEDLHSEIKMADIAAAQKILGAAGMTLLSFAQMNDGRQMTARRPKPDGRLDSARSVSPDEPWTHLAQFLVSRVQPPAAAS